MEGRENCGGLSQVEEEESCREFLINLGMLCVVSESESESEESLFSIDMDVEEEEDRVYVAVGKSKSSMDALVWTLKHAITPSSSSTTLFLIHVFPVIRLVPSPLGGMLPKSQANPKVVDTYLAQQRHKRNKLLQTFIDACSAFKVRVETFVVESDIPAKAISELIPSLNINRLVLGSTKSTLRKVKSRRGTVCHILENAPQTCEISIICKGKQVNDRPSSNGSPSPRGSSATKDDGHEPEIRRSHSDSAVGKPVSVHAWKVFKWVQMKPSRTPHLLPRSSFYQNRLK